MSILICGLHMPNKEKGELLCICINNDGRVCYDLDLTCKRIGTAIQLPPHGRLIDADALIEFIENRYNITWKDDYEGGIKDACVDILEKISTMPTIIPAEPAEEGE